VGTAAGVTFVTVRHPSPVRSNNHESPLGQIAQPVLLSGISRYGVVAGSDDDANRVVAPSDPDEQPETDTTPINVSAVMARRYARRRCHSVSLT
jgi:hypothetical protein